MGMENELIVYESKPLTANDIKAQVDLIQEVMHKVMKKDEHFGIIPGCGDKPALLKPGAEKLNMTFRMAPDPETEIIDLGGGHREYRVKCVLRAIESGRIQGAGVGSACTMETKWRFRNAEPEISDKLVPKEYWDLRKKDQAKAQELIGGKGFVTIKVDNNWMIAKLTGLKVEYDNPADYYNTCWKMAKKRALVDAVLTVTAASDIFTQDVDEMIENGTITPTPDKTKPPLQEPQKKNGDTSKTDTQKVITQILNVTQKDGLKLDKKTPYTIYTITGQVGEDQKGFKTFDKKIMETALKAKGTSQLFEIEYKIGQYGNDIVSMTEPGDMDAQT